MKAGCLILIRCEFLVALLHPPNVHVGPYLELLHIALCPLLCICQGTEFYIMNMYGQVSCVALFIGVAVAMS